MDLDALTSFGVFKPVGHVVMSFPAAQPADDTAQALLAAGASPGEVQRITDQDMVARATRDIARAGPLADLGQELNLVIAHRELAQRGYHFLVVKTRDDDHAAQVSNMAKSHGAERAQRYGVFIIEEMIEHSDDLQRVSDTPDRGLDPQTPSGTEAERADIRPSTEDQEPDKPVR